MRFCFLVICGSLIYSCNTPVEKKTVRPPKIVSVSLAQNYGPDCHLPDSLQQNCAHIDLHWPQVLEGPAPLKQQVFVWTTSFLAGLLDPAISFETRPAYTIDSAVAAFRKLHQEWIEEAPASAVGNFAAECIDSVLFQTENYLTLQLNGYTYTGGAHGLPQTAVQTFAISSGKPLGWADLVTDSLSLQTLAEQKFRQERAEIFEPDEEGNPGFEFDDTFVFKLPDQYGLIAEGILLFYNYYEVAPYALGSTALMISHEELGALKKY